ncbi:MAG: VIT domain-containing protein [Candidatus Thermoplasmatota archaeon]
MKRISIAILLCLSVIFPVLSIGSAYEDSETKINYLYANANICNSYGITEIKEEIENQYDKQISTTFSFHIPDIAFISNFSLTVDGRTYYAKVMEREEAEKKYEIALKTGKEAGMLYSRGKTKFSYALSLSPKQKVIVGLRYEEFIKKVLNVYEYNLSLLSIGKNIGELRVNLNVSYSAFITNFSSPNYKEDTEIEFISQSNVHASYEAKNTTPKKDFVARYEVSSPAPNGRMIAYNNGKEAFFMHVFSPKISDIGGEKLNKDIVFVLDKSGSMSGDKISQLKNAFSGIIAKLGEKETFNIIIFDDKISKYKDKNIEATEENKDNAIKYINRINAGGSTNINAALLTALKTIKTEELRAPIILFLTDGLPTAGTTNISEIRKNIRNENTQKVSIYSLGFGYDVNFEFLKAMSLENYGYATRIYADFDASVQIENFYATISTPLLKEIIFRYNDGYEFYPNTLEYLFEGSEAVVVGKFNGTSITSSVSAKTSLGERKFEDTFHFDFDMGNSFIERFWAYAKLNYLLEKMVVSEDKDTKALIVSIALNYSFVTPYTSLYVEAEGFNKETSLVSEFTSTKDKPVPVKTPVKTQTCSVFFLSTIIVTYVCGKKAIEKNLQK